MRKTYVRQKTAEYVRPFLMVYISIGQEHHSACSWRTMDNGYLTVQAKLCWIWEQIVDQEVQCTWPLGVWISSDNY